MTNFEKLKQEINEMSITDFAKNLDRYICSKIPINHCDRYGLNCKQCKIDFLKSEVE